ncbi:hypothetical protein [Streptomyces sp. NPDC029721]|uniref:hypothetical protein n=1 Tax=Streptomyces sp. NPDC029721 TaxID=3157090 RepID=UPI0033F70B8A
MGALFRIVMILVVSMVPGRTAVGRDVGQADRHRAQPQQAEARPDAGEALRAMAQLGVTCRDLPRAAKPARVLSPLQQASAMLGIPVTV